MAILVNEVISIAREKETAKGLGKRLPKADKRTGHTG
jgi:hypothetical protein